MPVCQYRGNRVYGSIPDTGDQSIFKIDRLLLLLQQQHAFFINFYPAGLGADFSFPLTPGGTTTRFLVKDMVGCILENKWS